MLFKNFSLKELKDYFHNYGKEEFRARRLYKYIYKENCYDTDRMVDLPIFLRNIIKQDFEFTTCKVIHIQKSYDETKKYLIQLYDGNTIESVAIPYKKRFTVCLSTQVGCNIKCSFCKTGETGFIRNLLPCEIIEQFILLRNDLPKNRGITNIVLMGIGEPLLNLDNVIKFIDIITEPNGLNFPASKITVSTVGIPDKIRELGSIKKEVGLAISLHAPNNEIRNKLIPINRIYPIETLLKACKDYPTKKKKNITFQYILIKSLNDSLKEARELSKILNGIPAKINLIPYNPIETLKFQVPTEESIEQFQNFLMDKGFYTVVRDSRGKDINAACGQLKANYSGLKLLLSTPQTGQIQSDGNSSTVNV